MMFHGDWGRYHRTPTPTHALTVRNERTLMAQLGVSAEIDGDCALR